VKYLKSKCLAASVVLSVINTFLETLLTGENIWRGKCVVPIFIGFKEWAKIEKNS
jgi:hypothetical protein